MVFDRVEDYLQYVVLDLVSAAVLLGRISRASVGSVMYVLRKDFINLKRLEKLLKLQPKPCPKQETDLMGEN